MEPTRIITPRLVLVPVSAAVAREIVAGDLDRIVAGVGWPHRDTLDGLRMVAEHGAAAWFVTLDGVVVGDCGTHGGVDEAGDVEIGYGIAPAYRRQGLATEVIAGLVGWLAGSRDVRRIVARRVLADNVGSRRALERNGFMLDEVGERELSYALGLAQHATHRHHG